MPQVFRQNEAKPNLEMLPSALLTISRGNAEPGQNAEFSPPKTLDSVTFNNFYYNDKLMKFSKKLKEYFFKIFSVIAFWFQLDIYSR